MRSRPGGLPGGGGPELGQSRMVGGCKSRSGRQGSGHNLCKGSAAEVPQRFLSWFLPYVAPPPPHLRSAPAPPPLSAHSLQRPWDRCVLLPPDDLGREHFWHMHSFPLKVTRSPGGKGNLQQEDELQARTTSALLWWGGEPHPRYTPSPPPGTPRTGTTGPGRRIPPSRCSVSLLCDPRLSLTPASVSSGTPAGRMIAQQREQRGQPRAGPPAPTGQPAPPAPSTPPTASGPPAGSVHTCPTRAEGHLGSFQVGAGTRKAAEDTC